MQKENAKKLSYAFDDREVKGQLSSPRTRSGRERYLNSPIQIGTSYISQYTRKWKELDGKPPCWRRAEAHAYALEHMETPIMDGDLIVGRKTKWVRGGEPYHTQTTPPTPS